MEAEINTPKKIPGPKFNPPKNPIPNFRAVKISRGSMRPGYAGTITNLQIVWNTQKNPFLNQATQKSTCQNFPSQKNPKIENFILKKSFDHPCHLKSGVPAWDDQLSGFESRQASIFFRLSHSNCISCISL